MGFSPYAGQHFFPIDHGNQIEIVKPKHVLLKKYRRSFQLFIPPNFVNEPIRFNPSYRKTGLPVFTKTPMCRSWHKSMGLKTVKAVFLETECLPVTYSCIVTGSLPLLE